MKPQINLASLPVANFDGCGGCSVVEACSHGLLTSSSVRAVVTGDERWDDCAGRTVSAFRRGSEVVLHTRHDHERVYCASGTSIYDDISDFVDLANFSLLATPVAKPRYDWREILRFFRPGIALVPKEQPSVLPELTIMAFAQGYFMVRLRTDQVPTVLHWEYVLSEYRTVYSNCQLTDFWEGGVESRTGSSFQLTPRRK